MVVDYYPNDFINRSVSEFYNGKTETNNLARPSHLLRSRAHVSARYPDEATAKHIDQSSFRVS